MQIQQTLSVSADILLIRPYEEGVRPENQTYFKAEKGETWWATPMELWIGLGKEPSLPATMKIFRSVFHKRKENWPVKIALGAHGRSAEWVEMVVNGILLGGYDIQLYKTNPKQISDFFGTEGVLEILVEEISDSHAEHIVLGQETAETQLRVMDLMNMPGNKKTPGYLAGWAVKSGKEHGYAVEVLEKERLEKEGFEALLSVSKGSMEPPVLIVTDYCPDNYTKTITLVGKGVTFDTGGISLKQSANMHLMKSDMGGAAAVLGAVELAAKLKLPIRVTGVIPSTENCIDGASTKPGDVIGSYSGKTIEVIDTDAEGRLILADGLSYATKRFSPDVLIDLATLTGSVIQTLGYVAAGLFTPNDSLAIELIQAADITGERVWRLPVWEEYQEELSSDIADVKNYHGKPLAGAIVAAKFLETFTDAHTAWAHLDIAGTAFGDDAYAPGRMGTAFGVRLLRKYLTDLG